MSGASTPSAVNTSRSNSVSDVPDGPGARGSSSLNSGKTYILFLHYWVVQEVWEVLGRSGRSHSVSDVPDGPGARGSSSLNSGI